MVHLDGIPGPDALGNTAMLEDRTIDSRRPGSSESA